MHIIVHDDWNAKVGADAQADWKYSCGPFFNATTNETESYACWNMSTTATWCLLTHLENIKHPEAGPGTHLTEKEAPRNKYSVSIFCVRNTFNTSRNYYTSSLTSRSLFTGFVMAHPGLQLRNISLDERLFTPSISCAQKLAVQYLCKAK